MERKMARKDLNEIFVNGINENRLSFYKTAKAILKNEEDVEDALQDALEMAYKNIEKLNEERYFKTWMTRILINKCYDIRKKNQNIICLDEYEEPAACDEYNLELKEALAALDEKYRIIMILFYSEGYRIREISDILKIPESTVKTRLQRGREKLEVYYKEK